MKDSHGKWTLEYAQEFAAKLEERLQRHGLHCAIGGSVMYAGRSDNDLDVIVYPHREWSGLPEDDVEMAVGALFTEMHVILEDVHYPGYRTIFEAITFCNRKVNLFLMRDIERA